MERFDGSNDEGRENLNHDFMCAMLAARRRGSELTGQEHCHGCAYNPASNRIRLIFVENK